MLSVSISSEAHFQGAAFRNVESASNTIKSLLKDLSLPEASPHTSAATSAFGTTTDADDTDAPPVTHWSSSTLTTYAYPGTYTDSQLSQYTASTSFTIIFRDFEQLGKLIITLSTMPLVSVREVGWSLTDGTKQALASQMRKEAVRDATRKATDLAEGAGRGVPRVVELADVDVDDRYAHHGRVQLQAAVRMQGGAAATVQQKQNEGMSFAPENVWLSAGVTARFEAV